jgi:hypothetical protein
MQMLDVIDCSGAGDVEMKKVELQEDGTLQGRRKLKPNPSWVNPSGSVGG